MPVGDECLEIQLPPGLERPRWLISHKLVKNAIRKDGHRDAAGQLALQNEAAGTDRRQCGSIMPGGSAGTSAAYRVHLAWRTGRRLLGAA